MTLPASDVEFAKPLHRVAATDLQSAAKLISQRRGKRG